MTPLCKVAGDGSLHALCSCMRIGSLKKVIDEKDNKGRTPLTRAIANGKIENAQWLIKKGASIKEFDPAAVQSVDKEGNTPLHLLARDWFHQRRKVKELLFSHGANVTAQNHRGETPFYVAIFHRNVELAQDLLIQDPTLLEIPDSKGKKPLQVAMENGNLDVIEFLLDAGADLTQIHSVETLSTALDARGGDPAIVEAILHHAPGLIHERGEAGRTILHYACSRGYYAAVESLAARERILECMMGKEWILFRLLFEGGMLRLQKQFLITILPFRLERSILLMGML